MEAPKPSAPRGKSQPWPDRRPGGELRQPQPAVPHPASAEGAYAALAEGPLPGSEGTAGAPGVESGQPRALLALRARVRDGWRGLFDRDDRGAVHRRVPLGDEGRASKAERDDPRDISCELRQ